MTSGDTIAEWRKPILESAYGTLVKWNSEEWVTYSTPNARWYVGSSVMTPRRLMFMCTVCRDSEPYVSYSVAEAHAMMDEHSNDCDFMHYKDYWTRTRKGAE